MATFRQGQWIGRTTLCKWMQKRNIRLCRLFWSMLIYLSTTFMFQTSSQRREETGTLLKSICSATRSKKKSKRQSKQKQKGYLIICSVQPGIRRTLLIIMQPLLQENCIAQFAWAILTTRTGYVIGKYNSSWAILDHVQLVVF